MTEAGDIYLADLNEPVRRRVLVVSSGRFNRVSDRVIVAPEIAGPPDDVPFPWRMPVGDAVFAVDFLRSVPVNRLLERTDIAQYPTMQAVRRAMFNIL